MYHPSVLQTQHPLVAFHANALKVRVNELGSLARLSTRFRLVGSIGSAGSLKYVAVSSSGHYELIPGSSCRLLGGVTVCKWAGGYVTVHPMHPKSANTQVNPIAKVSLPGTSSAQAAGGSIFP